MKVAVINFSGNVGKTTLARHLLVPNIPGAQLVSVESINADADQADALRGHQFGSLQEFLQVADDVVVDIGASNVEDLLKLMRRYHGSHEDFDLFVVPTVPAVKQQQDTIATLIELSRIGIAPERLRVVFNQLEDGYSLEESFGLVLSYLEENPIAVVDKAAVLGANEVYQRIKGTGKTIEELAADKTDLKKQIAETKDEATKLELASQVATRRLATGVQPQLQACFAALGIAA